MTGVAFSWRCDVTFYFPVFLFPKVTCCPSPGVNITFIDIKQALYHSRDACWMCNINWFILLREETHIQYRPEGSIGIAHSSQTHKQARKDLTCKSQKSLNWHKMTFLTCKHKQAQRLSSCVSLILHAVVMFYCNITAELLVNRIYIKSAIRQSSYHSSNSFACKYEINYAPVICKRTHSWINTVHVRPCTWVFFFSSSQRGRPCSHSHTEWPQFVSYTSISSAVSFLNRCKEVFVVFWIVFILLHPSHTNTRTHVQYMHTNDHTVQGSPSLFLMVRVWQVYSLNSLVACNISSSLQLYYPCQKHLDSKQQPRWQRR